MPEDLAILRNQLAVDPANLLVVVAARLSAEKRVEDLIRCVPHVLEAFPNARFIVVGEGPDREALERDAASSGKRSVTFLGFRHDVLDIIAVADVLVLPSDAEPFGIVLLEAMVLSKPVVAINCGGPAEIVADGITGVLVPPRDPISLAKGIIRLLGDPDWRRILGREGFQRYSNRFTASRMGGETLAVYKNIMQALPDRRH